MHMTIFAYHQFINWREEPPDPGKLKPKKVPFDPSTGKRTDPHDRTFWRSYEECAATGQLVGFVFTKDDPFFFVDLDDCAVGGEWQPEAMAVCGLLSGAAIEISRSGNGLHIVGTCDKSQFTNRKHKFGSPQRPENWIEFYIDGRFMALGAGFSGDFSADRTAQLNGFIPHKPQLPAVAFTAGPVAEYTGPADDAELIAKMLRATGGAGAAFGSKASIVSLWEADPIALGAAFPSASGDAFDRSSADAALFSHLAFWTGKDAARMDRLFRQSKLMRDKYAERADYQRSTIGNAIGNCRAVYNVAPRVATLPQVAGGPVIDGVIADDYLNILQMQQWFDGCVYVSSMHRVFMPNGDFLKPEQFNVARGGKQFQMTMDGSKPTTSAFEAFTQCRAISFAKARDVRFVPTAPSRSMIGENVNSYVPDPQPMEQGDVWPFLDLLAKLLPNETDRMIVLSYMAAVIQYPGHKFQWAPVLQGVEGNGKSFLGYALQFAVGSRFSHIPASEDLANKFNGYIENKLLIVVEEVHMAGRREVLDTLKPLVTNLRVEVQNKGADKRMVDNVANWIFFTNWKDAVIKTKNDRRYAVFFTAQQFEEDLARDGMNGDYFPRLYAWARQNGGFAAIHHYLAHMEIPPQFNPAGEAHRAPETSSTNHAIEESKGRAEQEIENAVHDGAMGWRGGWVSSARVKVLLSENKMNFAPAKIKSILESLGYREVCRATRPIIQEDMKRPTLFMHRTSWRRELTQTDYEIAQGYITHV